MNILQLRTKLSILNIKWNNLPHISNFTKYTYINNIDININDYRIIGYINLNYNIYFPKNTNENTIYLISDLDKTIYLSLGFSNHTLWYPILLENNILTPLHIELLSDLIEVYDINDDIDYDVTKYILLGDMYQINHNIKSIQSQLLKSNLIECLMWGSKYDSYPFDRHKVMFSNNKDKINYITKALQQNDNDFSITCRTLWSKSSIKIIQNMNYITMEIKYNNIRHNTTIDLINQYYSKNLSINMPTDLAITLIEFPYTDTTQLINQSDNIFDLITLLKILIPKNKRYDFTFKLDDYCNDLEKIKCIRQMLL